MKRRRGRRRRQRPPLGLLALLFVASAVVIAAIVLIVRGDTTPRTSHASTHRHSRSATTATRTAATSAPSAASGVSASGAGAGSRATDAPRVGTSAGGPPALARTAAPAAASAASAVAAGAPRLAIIIDDCGQWLDTERGFIALPVALTLSVLPHVRYSEQIARAAEAAGKGIMLHLPMEPRSGADPGPGRIMVGMDDAAIAAQVNDDLAAVPLAAGVNNHEGSRATADDRVMRDVANVLAQHHLFFVDSRTGDDTVAQRDAGAAGVPTARRDVFLDDVADIGATTAALRHAADLAKANGSAIAIGHPHPTTLLAVRALLPELARDGVVLVLARDLVH